MKTDFTVVGSGLAALTAARTAHEAGREVTLVWPGLTSLYFLSATIDVLGYASADALQPVVDPLDGVGRLVETQPDHPYARAGRDALERGVRLVQAWLASAGLSWTGSLTHNLLLPTATGTPKPTCLVPTSMAAGDLGRVDPIVLCGFEGYQDFAPELAAANLARHWTPGGGRVTAMRVPVPGFGRDRLFTSIDLARSFENAGFRDEVARQVRDRLPGGARLGMPAVLGLTRPDDVFLSFSEAVGHSVFEIPTVPPSVAGLRFFDRLRKSLQEAGVDFVQGAPAHRAEVDDGRCTRIWLKAAGREHPVEARAFVLALEDTVDGALRAGVHQIRDPFFGAVVAEHGEPIQRTSESFFDAHPFASVGLPVTDRLQPADETGRPRARNVFLAGGAMAGYDPTGTKSRGGMAIATGYRAAKEALAA
ncbi:MAG TPA: anaerobic glycerol-3-phosphate dehydrogenase subunit GlpB [Candidatus Dormibacteraeota bacterium]|nr:anaerobic glycerol-3-phosphate dehydrogenase subunit GlpB [Candidatus Dormibacteraeota bacterium]